MAQAAAPTGQLHQRRGRRAAHVDRRVTARVERAAEGNLAGPGRTPGDDVESTALRLVGRRVVGNQARHRPQQRPRVRVRWGGEDLLHGGLLHGMPGVHHGHVVGDGCHHAEVVGDQHEAHLALDLDLGEQPQHLRLDGDVQGGGRLVGDQHLRVQRQGGGDHHALTHAAGELVRIVPDAVGGPRHLDQVEQLDRPAPRLAAADAPPHPQHLGQLVAHRVHRIERGEGVLEHHRHLFTGTGATLLGGQRQQVGATEPNGAARHPSRRAEQPHDRERADRLATSGFADDRQGASGRHGVGETIDGVDDAVACAELDG